MEAEETEKNRTWMSRIHHLHYVYIIIILLLALIGYIAFCHSSASDDDKQLLTFLGFAATISSIILSVLAIIITVISSGATDRLRDSVIKMSLLPSEIASRFDKSSSELNDASSKIVSSTEKNKEESERSIAIIQEKISQLSGLINDRYKGHDEKIELVSRKLEEAMKQSGGGLGADVKKKEDVSLSQVTFFFERTSKATIILLYFIDKYIYCHISKPVSLTTFAEALGYGGDSKWMAKYFFASIVQMNSFKLLEYSNEASDFDLLRFSSINKIIHAEVGNYLSCVEPAITRVDSFVSTLEDNHSGEENKEV